MYSEVIQLYVHIYILFQIIFHYRFLQTLLFFKWTSSVQQLTTTCRYTLHVKEIQVGKWLSYLANTNAELHDPSSKDHFLPLHTSSNKNYWTWLWNMMRLSRRFPSFPFHFASRINIIHDFNFYTFSFQSGVGSFSAGLHQVSSVYWNLHFLPFLVITFLPMSSSSLLPQSLWIEDTISSRDEGIWEAKCLL